MPETPDHTPAGWYPDPTNNGRQRYWDGASWTSHFGPAAASATEAHAAPNPTSGTPVQTPTRRPWLTYGATALGGFTLGAIIFAAGGSATAQEPAPAPTVTVTALATATPSPAPTVTVTRTATATPEATASAPKPSKAPKIKVPDGVGLNYQEAQDLWRAAGLVVLPAVDATGANRLAVLDANWVVLEQDLKPGSSVDDGAGITATIKKFTDE